MRFDRKIQTDCSGRGSLAGSGKSVALQSPVTPGWLVVVLFLLFACTERIEIETEPAMVRLVVDGSLTTESGPHQVRLSLTGDYFGGRPAPPVTGAEVSLLTAGRLLPLQETSPGVYATSQGVPGIPGETYTLRVKTAFPVGGHTEFEATEVLLPPIHLDYIQLEFYPDYSEEGMWEARGYFRDPPDAGWYRFLAFRNNVLITDTLTEWYVTDDLLFGGRYVNGWRVAFLQQHRPDEALAPGDTLTIRMDRISREYADFIQGAQAEMRGSWPLFTGPPANVKGNVSNGAIGFFAAFPVSQASAVVPGERNSY